MTPSLRRLLLPALAALFACLSQAPAQVQQDRIAARPDLSISTRLAGHVPLWAVAANDLGPAPDAAPLQLTFVLARSSERQAAFTRFLEDQQNPASPSYHHWLTPQQIGTLYGPTQHDLAALTIWLTAQGLTVTGTTPSRTFLSVEAPVAAVSRALTTSFHLFAIPGDSEAKSRLAATAEPAIPIALTPLVAAITGLADIPVRPMLHYDHAPIPQAASPAPNGTNASSGKHYIAPADFAVLYDLNPAYQSGLNGAGQKVAIVGRSRTLDTDISRYETASNLPVKQPNVIIVPGATDPGITNTGDQDEATLDVDRVLGTAPGVQADLILATGSSGGIQAAAQYNIQTLLDPVLNISFGACESGAGRTGATFWDTLFAQAAAEGISVFVSSGDAGSAGCQAGGIPLSGNQPRTINVICASSYVTCVGGTEFADTASPSTWWNSSNGTGLETAISYIPEGAWNEPTDTANNTLTYVPDASGGGASAFIPKPSWQAGPGVPADGARDVPDIAFSASIHNGYFFCLNYKGDDCITYIGFFGGTSAATPSMAAIAAIFDGKTGGPQGNLNPLLYRLAATTPAAFHDATPASSGVTSCSLTTPSMCNNSIPSSTGLTGGIAGYALTPGYDQATGLGSLDVAAFLNAAAATASLSLSPATPTLTLTQGASTGNTDLLTLASQVYAGTAALTCTVAFNGPGTAASLPICNLNPSSVTIAPNGTATTTLSFATTKPHLLHAATQAPNAPSPILAAVGPPTRTRTPLHLALCSLLLLLPLARSRKLRIPLLALLLSVTLGTLAACSGASKPISPNPLLISTTTTAITAANPTIFAGSADTFTINVTNTGFNTTVQPTGTVQLFLGGASTPVTTATVTAGVATATIPFTAPGAYDIYALYTGDNSFSGSNSGGAHVVVQALGTTLGSYTVTVNAATPSGGPTASTSIALTVQ